MPQGKAAAALGISISMYLEQLTLADAEACLVRPAGPYIQEPLETAPEVRASA
ncbi:hypothetical protein ATL40_2888 [Serinibacter salmoneus]|uniref:Uncharacterized protein n=1 Tax=Serinibacter salmoneus TaxID=556530 RepID=A0A2A9D3N0_9MICO|nr:hypothetical protein ATL40_2888 [Serinibacter salmoneus]